MFVVLSLVIGFTHGPHISTNAALALAFGISVSVSGACTLGYCFAHIFYAEKFTVNKKIDGSGYLLSDIG